MTKKKVNIKLEDKVIITVIDSNKPFHKVYGNYEVSFDSNIEKIIVRKLILKDLYR